MRRYYEKSVQCEGRVLEVAELRDLAIVWMKLLKGPGRLICYKNNNGQSVPEFRAQYPIGSVHNVVVPERLVKK